YWIFGCTKQLEEEFYRKNFRFLDPRLVEDRVLLEAALDDLGVLLPADGPRERRFLVEMCMPSLELLARPFRMSGSTSAIRPL
ncbi:MAG: hypothetical protein HC901_01335, partial [Bdellovibrionaceae bacterium]|nr:hypothetical protein [Pseudobdellovibrionaceae bacterium]